MKLLDLILELEKSKTINQENVVGSGFMLDPFDLKSIEKRLFECDEFKKVIRINYVSLPSFLVEEESEEPISSNREFIGGNTSIRNVSEYKINPGQEIKFNKVVDIYTIFLNKRFLLKEEISRPGIWIYPTVFSDELFEPTNQIRIVWDPEKLTEALKIMGVSETPKERLVRMFESALDNMAPNIPCEYMMTLRCSERSIDKEVSPLLNDIIDDVFSGNDISENKI